MGRTKKASIKMNFIYQMIYEVLLIILPLVTSPYIARVFGSDGLGTYSYSYSIAYYFVLFSMMGLANYGNRSISQSRDDKDKLNQTFSSIFALHFLISLFFLALYIIYSFLTGQDRVLAHIQTIYVLSALFDIGWLYFGLEQFKLSVIRNVSVKLLTVAAVFIFVRHSGDLWKYCLIMALGSLLSQLSLWLPLHRFVSFKRPSWEEMKKHIKPMLILFIPAIAVSLYKYMDKIMIGFLSTKSELGFYENADKITTIPVTVIASFGTVMMPRMANMIATGGKKEVGKYIDMSMKYILVLALALAFGLIGIAEVFSPVFWGNEFERCSGLIVGLSFTIPFIAFANVIRTQYLIPNSKDKEYVLSVIAGAVVNLLVNGLLIKPMGAYGAMIGTIFAEMTVCILQAFFVRDKLPVLSYAVRALPFAALGAVMAAAVRGIGIFMGDGIFTLLVQVMAGVFIYAFGTFLWFYVRKDEIVMKLIGKIR